jgi:hypothetical protein
MRSLVVATALLMLSLVATPTSAQVGVAVGVPGTEIGIEMSSYPDLVPVPGYPVYYDPEAGSNYFFYDGLYWAYQGDNWYASNWYDGPWDMVAPEDVPLFVLRVPVRYYRAPPRYFASWDSDAPPRWGEQWGHDWEEHRRGWDQWDRHSVPPPAPLPTYQRQYSGDRYPRAPDQQVAIRSQNYRYQPHEAVTQQHFAPQGHLGGNAEPQRQSRVQPQPSQPGRPGGDAEPQREARDQPQPPSPGREEDRGNQPRRQTQPAPSQPELGRPGSMQEQAARPQHQDLRPPPGSPHPQQQPQPTGPAAQARRAQPGMQEPGRQNRSQDLRVGPQPRSQDGRAQQGDPGSQGKDTGKKEEERH